MEPKAAIFEFTSYQFEPAKKRVIFNYKTVFEAESKKAPIAWTETILLPKAPNLQAIPKETINKTLESLHIILGISYYKAYCPPAVVFAKAGVTLTKKEADFWNTVYKKGLGEFFYKNKLHPNISPKFPVTNKKRSNVTTLQRYNKYLVGIGGGKDSIVAAQLLKEGGFDITAFNIEVGEPSKLVEKVIEVLNVGDLKIQRVLDPKIYQNHQYNGHIPISAIYAFLGIFTCLLYKYSYFIVSNEHSSNFGNITYKGLEINHQWSKSFEFEALFSDYVKNNISADLIYFSLLRSFYEIRIVKLFSKYKTYFSHFSSCNRNFTLKGNANGTLWCGQCAKCVFVFTMLSAFVNKKELLKIFGTNLYEDKALLPLFKDVLGFGTLKPFDCVGTFQEAQTALFLAKRNFSQSFIMRQIGSRAKYHKEVFETVKETNIPEQFRFLGMESALILGYGKEGKITKEYLKKYYPKIKIGIGDENINKNYLKNQKSFDIAIKTPGIKKELVTIPYTTATNIFFSNIKGKNPIIGVTGSKGKSTTASLIWHILKTAGKDVQLLGNIGKPMLQTLLAPVPKNRIFVLELSSYQLDDIKFSPDIAVVTNLFPEHMDFHGGLQHYYQAKQNIINFQGPHEYFIYNKDNLIMRQWLKSHNGKAIPFAKNNFEHHLIGEHNEKNIGAAIAAVKILGVSDTAIKKALATFKSLLHRLERVGTYKGITFYNDANAATPEAAIMALKALKNVGAVFLGGQDRGYDFTDLEKTIKKYNIKNIVLFPDSGPKILKSTKGLNILKTKSMQEAVAFAYKYTPKGSICLLSCASPSYSLWKNFEQKGDEFKKFVKMLSK